MHTDVRMQKGEGCTVHFFPVLKLFFFFFSFFNLQLRGAFVFRGAINKCFLHALIMVIELSGVQFRLKSYA